MAFIPLEARSGGVAVCPTKCFCKAFFELHVNAMGRHPMNVPESASSRRLDMRTPQDSAEAGYGNKGDNH